MVTSERQVTLQNIHLPRTYDLTTSPIHIAVDTDLMQDVWAIWISFSIPILATHTRGKRIYRSVCRKRPINTDSENERTRGNLQTPCDILKSRSIETVVSNSSDGTSTVPSRSTTSSTLCDSCVNCTSPALTTNVQSMDAGITSDPGPV